MIILTGGAGFIGSNLLAGLNNQGRDDIIVVDNLKNASKHLNLNARQFQDFIPKEQFLEAMPKMGKIDLILHQGACSSTTETDGQYMMDNNYEYSKKILDFCMAHRIPLIYASSASVYGNGERGFSDQSDNFFPLNVYAYSKLLFDRRVRKILANQENTVPLVGLRYFNVYGYQENHKGDMASVPYKFFQQMKQGGEITLFKGSGSFFRDFIFIEDIVAIVLSIFDRGISGIFNAGTGLHRSFQDIANIFQAHFPAAKIKYIPFPEHLNGKYQRYTSADLSHLQSSGFTHAFATLEDGISCYIRQLQQTDGYLL